MNERRRVRRLPATWPATCHIDGDPPHTWRECNIFDVSALGMGIDLVFPLPSVLVGRRISVRVPSIAGASIDMTLKGEVRNASAGPDGTNGTTRVGIELVSLSERELYLVDLLRRSPLSA